MRGYLNADPACYDLILRDASQPFFDYLNIRYVYVPPDQRSADWRFVEIYRGTGRTVLQKTASAAALLPRSAFPRRAVVRSHARALERDSRLPPRGARRSPNPARALCAVDLGGGSVTRSQDTAGTRRYSTYQQRLEPPREQRRALARMARLLERPPPAPVIVNGAFLGCFISNTQLSQARPPGSGSAIIAFRQLTPAACNTALVAPSKSAPTRRRHADAACPEPPAPPAEWAWPSPWPAYSSPPAGHCLLPARSACSACGSPAHVTGELWTPQPAGGSPSGWASRRPGPVPGCTAWATNWGKRLDRWW